MHARSLLRSSGLVGALLLGAGCRDAAVVAPPGTSIAGSYVLEPSGRGPVSGTFVLRPSGAAERRVRYITGLDGMSRELVAIGTYELRPGGAIDFALREDGGASPYVWNPNAQRAGAGFTIRYGDPLDGPDYIETYRLR